ncbi:helix-turn-helix domain-containing protein [Bradyrhizobium sp. Ash2021]|uniref:helix-turn-helix domain-containing protein n=1 Tax=Bradyrhizobium sp. Ash2021 TaxID=2954771 RepID=UPI0028150FA2|nr:helix-turn-helix domain-containing protein [Bradyrhizobium sp. Ash2021]WMT71074.1 helix-turn-helix domain-containing protein [Bradyrhizobium sp. Ash2021]
MTDTFTRDLFAWLNQVLADRSLPATAFMVAYRITQHINRKSGRAWPSQDTLAKATGLTVRSIRSLTDRLQEGGHLDIEPHRGRRQTNIYRLAIKRKPASGLDDDNDADDADASSDMADDKEEASFPNSDEENRKPASAVDDEKEENQRMKRGNPAHEKRKPASDEPSENQAAPHDAAWEGKKASERAPEGRALEEGFKEFWQLWQRGHHDDREQVSKAFIGAASKHDMADILASARRWAAAREPQYLPEPVKWLKGGWQSEPPPKRSTGGGSGRRSGGKPDPVEEALRAGGFDVGGKDE